jgi:hypothetical protein
VNVLPQDVQRTLVSVSSGCICFKENLLLHGGQFQGSERSLTLTLKRTLRSLLLFRLNAPNEGFRALRTIDFGRFGQIAVDMA